jgi:pimeloyl-ACP methyl ester carboxylesterase
VLASYAAFGMPLSAPDPSPASQRRRRHARRGSRAATAFATCGPRRRTVRATAALRQGWPVFGLTNSQRGEHLDAADVPYRELPGLEFMFEDEAIWHLCAKVFDYDPGPALSHIRAPLLALFGAADKVTPPEESVDALRHAVRPELLQVEVFPEGDHRLKCGEPPRFVDGYLDRIASFVRAAGSGTLS